MWTALSPAVDNLKLPERGGGEMRTLASSRHSAINKIARIMVTFKLLHPFKGSVMCLGPVLPDPEYQYFE